MEENNIAGFKPVYVFDVTQTEGKELPDIAKEIATSSDLSQELILRLHEIAAEKGIEVSFYQDGHGDAKGYYNPIIKEIGLKDAAKDQQAKTFLHELAHALTQAEKTNYKEGEIIAEGTAFIVAAHFGLDTSNYSFEYVAAWASRAKADALKRVAKTIQKTANELIQLLQAKEKLLVR